MRSVRSLLPVVLAASLLLSTGGCGAGLITGIASSDRGGGATSPAPELSVPPELLLPLVPAPGTQHTLVVTNARIGASSSLQVRIRAGGVEVEQPQPIAVAQGAGTSIGFTLATAPIVAAVGDPTAADVPGEIGVWLDGALLARPAPIVLVRQPRASLLLPTGVSERFVSPLGERVALRVEGLRSATADSVQVLVATRDPSAADGLPKLIRLGAEVRFEPADGGAPIVSVVLPGSSASAQAELLIRCAVAGLSTPVTDLYYRPDVALALPSQGPTTGGSLLTLIGTALVPHDYTTGTAPAPFDFAAVELSFQKGGRVTQLAPTDFRPAESRSDRLVFTMPPSPDGRPGQVDIVLRVRVGGTTAQVTASQVFLFANPDPFFGPRGVVLDRLPVAVAPIVLDGAVAGGSPTGTAAPDFAALTEQGGVGFLQLLLAQQNGMFQRFAAPRQIGSHENAAERDPRDLCVGDFDGDGVPDLFVVNFGTATAVHHLVLGQARPLPPLGAVHRFAAPGGSWRGRSAGFDGDLLPDVLLVPGPGAPTGQRPHVLLARPVAAGAPAFAGPVELPVRGMAYEAFEVADLDGDTVLDVAVVSGTEGKLDVAYGNGDGTFAPAVALDFTVPGYTVDAEAPAVGLHACADGPRQSLALVLSGLRSSFGGGPTQPTITVLRQPTPRVFATPLAAATYSPPTEPIGRSLAADLDGQAPIELVVAMRDEPQLVSLGLLQLGQDRFEPIDGAIEFGAESPKQIRAVLFARAFPATAQSDEARAVFLVHETEVDGVREKRLSTRLVVGETPTALRLLPPDAGDRLGFPTQQLVAGNFHPVSVAGGGAVRDLALVRPAGSGADTAIVLVANDGFGGFPRLSHFMESPGLLADSVTLLASAPGEVDRLVFADVASRLGIWRHAPDGLDVQQPDAVTVPLRTLLADPRLVGAPLADATRLRVHDVDGDGIEDLVVVLRFVLPDPGENQAALALLRGKVAPAPSEFPFHVPTSLTLVHGNTTAFTCGDFANGGAGAPRRLELALTVPVGAGTGGLDGDHVRFYRYQAGAGPAGDRFVPAAAAGGPQVLLAGSNPTELAAADFDRDGLVDLLVLCRGDATLRLFRNTAPIDPVGGSVHVADFLESLASPLPLAAGLPTELRLGDVNGDGSLDAVVWVESTAVGTGLRSTTIATYLSSGAGEFTGPRFVSPKRLGDRDGRLHGDLGDWNRDGVPDLFLGWGTNGPGDINLRVLFGGTK